MNWAPANRGVSMWAGCASIPAAHRRGGGTHHQGPRHISEDGIVRHHPINKLTGEVETTPEIVTRGFNPGEDGLWMARKQIVMQTWMPQAMRRRPITASSKRRSGRILKRYIVQQTQAAADHAVILEI